MEPIIAELVKSYGATKHWDDPTPFDYRPSRTLVVIAGIISAIVIMARLGAIRNRRWNETTLEMVGRNLLRIPAFQRKFDDKIKRVGQKESVNVLAEWSDIKGRLERKLDRKLDAEVFKFRHDGYPVEEIIAIFDVINRMVREHVYKKQFSGAIYPSELNSETIRYPERVQGQSDLAYIYMVIQSQAYLWNTLHKEFSPVRFLQYWTKEMVASLFGAAPHSTIGFDTTGGTGSLMQAVRIYKERGRERGVNPGEGIIIAPSSIHAAELKGGIAYDVKFVLVDLDESGAVDLEKMKEAIEKYASTGKLLAVFSSAPCYGTGTVDPSQEIIDYAKRFDIPVNIDACLGGLVVKGDFIAQGASSITVDPHKNGHAPKGSSLLLVKNELAKYSVYALPDWTCIYGTPKDEGSQACVNSICVFAALLYYGKAGYMALADKIVKGKELLHSRLKEVNGIEIVGRPDVNVIAFRFAIADGATYALVHEMSKRGWELNALKDNMAHICLTTRMVENPHFADEFIAALDASMHEVRQMSNRGDQFPGDAGLYCNMGDALRPNPKKLKFQEYVENMLLGKKGAEESVKAHIVAQLNPYAS